MDDESLIIFDEILESIENDRVKESNSKLIKSNKNSQKACRQNFISSLSITGYMKSSQI